MQSEFKLKSQMLYKTCTRENRKKELIIYLPSCHSKLRCIKMSGSIDSKCISITATFSIKNKCC